MRYLTHYEEYPIFEPAEGGYYYAGNQVTESERMSKRACKKALARLWEEAKAENLAEFGEEIPKGTDSHGNRIYPWIRLITPQGVRIIKRSRYIGDGESFVIEKRCGSEERGYVPYC